jgi:hypothetical protein
MGFFDALLGNDAADAARAAAADTYKKQQQAGADLRGYGDTYASQFRDLSGAYDPYVQTGLASNTALQRLLMDPSSVRSLPGYQFDQEEGIQALDRSAAARGMLNSGRASKDILRFSQGLADKTYGDQLARLMGVNQQGLGATGAQVGTVGTGLQGQLGTRTTSYGGDMGAAGTIGQGDIAAANARATALSNLMNFGGNLAGKAMGTNWFDRMVG